MPNDKTQCELNLCLNVELLKLIEDAAIATGQTVNDYAISTLAEVSRLTLEEQRVTRLSNRDRDILVAVLNDQSTSPNDALKEAVIRYRKQFTE